MSWPTRSWRSETAALETGFRDDVLISYNKAQALGIHP